MNTSCSICTDTIINIDNNYAVTSCNHKYHLSCLFQVEKNECPLCRNKIYVKENQPLIIKNERDKSKYLMYGILTFLTILPVTIIIYLRYY